MGDVKFKGEQADRVVRDFVRVAKDPTYAEFGMRDELGFCYGILVLGRLGYVAKGRHDQLVMIAPYPLRAELDKNIIAKLKRAGWHREDPRRDDDNFENWVSGFPNG